MFLSENRFGRQSTCTNLYTVVNSSPSSSASSAGGKRRKGGNQNKNKNKKSFISCWDTLEWKLTKTRTIGNKPITSFDISEDGTLLAYGSSDLSIGILDSKTLRVSLIIHTLSVFLKVKGADLEEVLID